MCTSQKAYVNLALVILQWWSTEMSKFNNKTIYPMIKKKRKK